MQILGVEDHFKEDFCLADMAYCILPYLIYQYEYTTVFLTHCKQHTSSYHTMSAG